MRLDEGRADSAFSQGVTFKRQRKDRGCGVLDGVGWGLSAFKTFKAFKGADHGPTVRHRGEWPKKGLGARGREKSRQRTLHRNLAHDPCQRI